MKTVWLFIRLFFTDAFRGGPGHQTVILWRAAKAVSKGNIACSRGTSVEVFLKMLDIGRLLGELP